MADEDRQYYDELDRLSITPLWSIITQTREPKTAVQPYLWRWREYYPHLRQAGEVMRLAGLQGEGAVERRVLLFVNPGLKQFNASTNTLVSAVQMIFPGEIAPAHRHSPTAVRFILQGKGAYSTVEGEKAMMEPGDLILTPHDTWHDHGNETDEPVIWFDGLDRMLVQHLDAVFSDPHPTGVQELNKPPNYSVRRYGSTRVRPLWQHPPVSPSSSPQIHYQWADTEKALRRLAELDESGPCDEIIVAYVNPETGGHALSTLACCTQILPSGSRTKAQRHTGSAVCIVFQGAGASVLDGQRITWERGDVFIIPPWTWYEHANTSASEEAFLFCINDLPVFQSLGLHREQRYEEHSGYQQVTSEFAGNGNA